MQSDVPSLSQVHQPDCRQATVLSPSQPLGISYTDGRAPHLLSPSLGVMCCPLRQPPLQPGVVPRQQLQDKLDELASQGLQEDIISHTPAGKGVEV